MHFTVIDDIIAWEPGDWIRAEKHLHAEEPFLPDHFPGSPVLPGVLTLEAMAQAGDWLVQSGRKETPGKFRMQTIRAVKFMHFARPGDTVTTSVKLVAERADGADLACQAMVGERVAASARMTIVAREDHATAALENDLASTAEFRWLWLDRFVEFNEGRSAKAVKQVPHLRQDYSFGRVFPEQLTATLVLEGLAQTGGILAFDAIRFRKAPIMAKIAKAEFFEETVPGSALEYTAELERLDDDGAAVRVTSRCESRLHAQAQFLFAFVASEGGAAVDPAIFYTMMCNTGAFEVPRGARVRGEGRGERGEGKVEAPSL
jgi:3-hydroxyacyl-[acyl-carrier-protein] dehydratase